MSVLEPWILLRLLAGLTAVALFGRAAVTSLRLLRHFDLTRASEGQLALERQMELATSFVRVGAVVQIGAFALTVLSADRLSHSIRGAMCAYGVFQENGWGFPALMVSGLAAFVAGVASQLCAFDRRLRGLDVVRAVAWTSLLVAPLAVADLACSVAFFGGLDLTAVASCCSTRLDLGIGSTTVFASGSREVATWLGAVGVVTSLAVGWGASIRPRRSFALLAAAVSLAALPLAVRATVLEVAPHAFERPQHLCPFCLLHGDVLWMGYPLYGGLFLGVVWCVGAATAGVALHRGREPAAFSEFARARLRRSVAAWLVSAVVGVIPVLHYAIASGGRSLFR